MKRFRVTLCIDGREEFDREERTITVTADYMSDAAEKAWKLFRHRDPRTVSIEEMEETQTSKEAVR
jgi:hypothetical protein